MRLFARLRLQLRANADPAQIHHTHYTSVSNLCRIHTETNRDKEILENVNFQSFMCFTEFQDVTKSTLHTGGVASSILAAPTIFSMT